MTTAIRSLHDKPLLIFGFGGWSASTPLYKTLVSTNKVVCKNIAKEPNILSYIFSKNNDWENVMLEKYNHSRKKGKKGYEIFLQSNLTIDYYIEWLLYRCNNEYLGVSDFSNPYTTFHSEIIGKFAEKFKKHFTVKVLIICRDPVSRLFSHLNSISNTGHSLDGLGQNKRLELVMDYICEPPEVRFPYQDWDHREKWYSPYMCSNYPAIYANWSQWFDTHMINMEDLWGGKNNELEKLNNFLGTKITKLHKNLYYPFRGPDIDFDEGLKDQWRSETEWITKENYDRARKRMSWAYTIQGRNPWKIS